MMRSKTLFSVILISSLILMTAGAASAGRSSVAAMQDCGSDYCNHQGCDFHCNCYGHEIPRFTFEDLSRETSGLHTDSLISEYYLAFPPMVFEPRIFSGYRSLSTPNLILPPYPFEMDARKDAYDRDRYAGILYAAPVDSTELEEGDEVLFISDLIEQQRRQAILDGDSTALHALEAEQSINAMQAYLNGSQPIDMRQFSAIPRWLSVAMSAERMHQDMVYRWMTKDPNNIQYAIWDLPVPPRLPEEDKSFAGFLRRLDLPAIDISTAIIPETAVNRINWLHIVGGGLQLSQAYISRNWYQGGNNYLAILFNFNWNVSLNTVYHPNLLFVSDLSYKLAVNSNPKGSLHPYSISQDQFQYTLKTGVKARDKWFYSMSLLFKTQLFTAYADDSEKLKAKFLSPAEFNVGLGMTYNTKALKDRLSLSVSIAPLSYNLKACPSMRIDHTQFNIQPDRKTVSQFGSNAELNLLWNFTDNISWKSRVFLFTNYSYFQADWENTFNFAINKFLSTQLYIYPRFDSSSDRNTTSWRYWQLKEILSFGLSYTFTTKP
ncbi:MAG: DUF3078 domain-containing protein [Muribaculaceae bacterium]|nr:DUF3078 domain-containing protein [Muribaculaceae bacterium]